MVVFHKESFSFELFIIYLFIIAFIRLLFEDTFLFPI